MRRSCICSSTSFEKFATDCALRAWLNWNAVKIRPAAIANDDSACNVSCGIWKVVGMDESYAVQVLPHDTARMHPGLQAIQRLIQARFGAREHDVVRQTRLRVQQVVRMLHVQSEDLDV